MSGRIYDPVGTKYIYCSKCGSEMWTSIERNHWGPLCKNKLCDGSIMDAIYLKDKSYFRKKKLNQLLNGKSINHNKSV